MSLHASARPRLRRTRGGTRLPRVDGRTLAAKRYRELLEVCEAEFGAAQSSADRELFHTWATLSLLGEQMAAALVRGETIDHDALVRTSSEARRVWSALKGKAAENKPATGPSIEELFAAGGANAE